MNETLSELFAAIASWAIEAKGAENVGAAGDLWIEKTEPNQYFPVPVTVKMNATNDAIEGIPPFHAMLENDVYFPGIMALLSPYGGMMLGAGWGDEGRLIKHFASQSRPQLS